MSYNRSIEAVSIFYTADRDHGHLRHVVNHLAHLLPAQGPIGVFIHHNTLHAFQHLPFEQAVVEASAIYGTQPYMTEEAFRAQIANGRIRTEDITAILDLEPNVPILTGPSPLDRRGLRQAMILPGMRPTAEDTIEWHLSEGGLIESAADSRLFSACSRPELESERDPQIPQRPHDGMLAHFGIDLDGMVNPLLTRLAGAFLDQGVAYWPMPERERGFLHAAYAALRQPYCVLPKGLHLLPVILRWHDAAQLNAETIVGEALRALGAVSHDWENFLRGELLALPGWAGMIWRLQEEPELAPHQPLPSVLMEFLAVRMTLVLAAVSGVDGHPRIWQSPIARKSSKAQRLLRDATFFQAAKSAGIPAEVLENLPRRQMTLFHREVFEFGDLERRRILQLAYERRHERQILLPLCQHRQRGTGPPAAKRPSAQAFFCIDEREESIRRQWEELDPTIETFGAAGFFGVAMDYCGVDDAHGVALCPVVVKPQHKVHERPAEGHAHTLARRRLLRKRLSRWQRGAGISTRTLFRGWLSTVVLGVFSLIPLAARVLSPRHYARLIHQLNQWLLPEPRTELAFHRAPEQHPEGLLPGFTITEKVERVAGVLAAAGLVKDMSRLVLILGHGSTSLNNPHESAHDCGACGGRRGGPNARLFAAMANHPQVRAGLLEKGVYIPQDTWFVGGYHDTCNDDADLLDLHLVPSTHTQELARVRASLDLARQWSAHERARLFEAASGTITPAAALRHMQERAEHLAEPRPEYGHCTNAVTIVGRRAATKGLFFDRRAFLVSYDPTIDPDDSNLAKVLGAVIPVCGGISLEYYFSFVDNEGYGCGTKLPHNITGLHGVMNGYESDLRTGLPWQMVEIHEPVRNLFIVESTPQRVLTTIHASPLLTEFLENRWIRLAVLDPAGAGIQMYRGSGVFEPVSGTDETLPTAASSVEWYQGHMEHLPVARIESLAGVR